MTKVSVIMNCLNGEKYLKEAIDSVFAQTYSDWEIVFFDNASVDRSAEIANGYGEKLRYFSGKETVNLGHARNLALKEASGDLISFLDVDDIWFPDMLEKTVALMESDENLGIVYADCMFIDGHGNPIGTTDWGITNYSEKVKFHRGYVFKELLWKDFIPITTAVVRKWMTGEGFRDYHIVEEYDLFLRIARHWKVDFVPDVLAQYRWHDGNSSKNDGLLVKEELELLNYWCERDRRMVSRWMELKKKIKLIGRYERYNFMNLMRFLKDDKSFFLVKP